MVFIQKFENISNSSILFFGIHYPMDFIWRFVYNQLSTFDEFIYSLIYTLKNIQGVPRN